MTIANGSVEQADFGRTQRLIGAVPTQTVAAGGALDVTVPLTDAAAGHRLLYSLEGNVPAGMTINPATGELNWTPTSADAGRHTATVRVRDPFDTRVTDTREVTIDVTKIANAGRVIFGSTVHLINVETDDKVVYRIVGDDEADAKHGTISVGSPLARAMVESRTLQTERTREPFCLPSRRAASVSAVSPDWETGISMVLASRIGPR